MHALNYNFSNFESWSQLRSRIRTFIDYVTKEYAATSDSDMTVIVVTHGAVCSAFIDELVPSLGDMKHDIRYVAVIIMIHLNCMLPNLLVEQTIYIYIYAPVMSNSCMFSPDYVCICTEIYICDNIHVTWQKMK